MTTIRNLERIARDQHRTRPANAEAALSEAARIERARSDAEDHRR